MGRVLVLLVRLPLWCLVQGDLLLFITYVFFLILYYDTLKHLYNTGKYFILSAASFIFNQLQVIDYYGGFLGGEGRKWLFTPTEMMSALWHILTQGIINKDIFNQLLALTT